MTRRVFLAALTGAAAVLAAPGRTYRSFAREPPGTVYSSICHHQLYDGPCRLDADGPTLDDCIAKFDNARNFTFTANFRFPPVRGPIQQIWGGGDRRLRGPNVVWYGP